MAVTDKYIVGAQTIVLTTQLNGLANNALALSGAFSNLQGGAGDGYTLVDIELGVTFAAAPTAGTGCSLWFLGAQNGVNYEDGNATTTPGRRADRVIQVRSVATAQRILLPAWMPWGLVMVLLKNDGTGQAFAATGNTLGIRVASVQGV